MNLIMIALGSITVILPVLCAMKKDKDKAGSRLTIPGIIFLFCAAGYCGAGFFSVKESENAAEAASKNVIKILNQIETESSRLSWADFQLRVELFIRPEEREPDRSLQISGKLGDSWFTCELLKVRSPDVKSTGRGGVGTVLTHYYANNFTFEKLHEYPYLNNLNGKVLTFSLPTFKMDLATDTSMNWAHLYIKGHYFNSTFTNNGNTSIPISLNLK